MDNFGHRLNDADRDGEDIAVVDTLNDGADDKTTKKVIW